MSRINHVNMEFNINEVRVVTTIDGKCVTNDKGEICIENLADGNLYFLQPTQEVLETLRLTRPSETEPQDGSDRLNLVEECVPLGVPARATSSSSGSEETSTRTKWNHNAIDTLINLRIMMDKQFTSTTQKTEVTWKRLADEMRKQGFVHTATQCSDKWRYLKAKYMRKKDNMGSRGTGESPIDFDYFKVLDEFLGKKHNVVPAAIASSIQGDTMPSADHACVLADEPEHDTPQPPKKRRLTSAITTPVKNRKSAFETVVENITTASKSREENRERRHQEVLDVRNRAIDVFNKKMDDLMDVMRQK